ncbi:hypothetical protein [Allomuricauda sp. SCSIO 65647]|uniref:hypothetical protein n=1 Tax=Allomuricauda sp. SCSIO 65647 TaxID=2908843 RepID=UPI001F377ACC|nr:hypothetical protein [Muricauda sp. SCSIO 65647]UJH67521.1 hypothetical protein L0P89_16425 [Muricauda sp. SCSIO 65647]
MDSTKECIHKKNSFFRLFSFIVIAIPIICFSQDLERKGKFFFSLGPEYRITPVYKLNNISREALFTNPDMQNSGISLNIGVSYYITERLSVGFNNSFRYDLIVNESDGMGNNTGVSNAKNDIIFGYHFSLGYHFPVFKNGDLFANVGVSLLNRNTGFSITEPVFNGNGDIVGSITSQMDFGYGANRISIGYAKGKSKVMIGTYVSTNTGYFQETTTFWVPFINYSYDFGKL